MSKYNVGDKLSDHWGDEIEIVAKSYILVDDGRHDIFITKEEDTLVTWTEEELDDSEYTLKDRTKEMTVAEIAEKLGHPVKVIEG